MDLYPHALSIRLRPAMYIGGVNERGICELLEALMEEMIACRQGNPVFEWSVGDSGKLSLVAYGMNVEQFSRQIELQPTDAVLPVAGWACLVALSAELDANLDNGVSQLAFFSKSGEYEMAVATSRHEGERIKLDCTLDASIFTTAAVTFQDLVRSLRKFAFLYPGTKLFVAESAGDQQKLVFYQPNGLADELQNHLSPIAQLMPPTVRLSFIASLGERVAEVVFCYQYLRKDTHIVSYANRSETYDGGSLVEGVLEGIMDACNRVAEEKGMSVSIDRNNITSNLILLTAIKGEGLVFAGAIKHALDMPDVRTGMRQLTDDELYRYLMANDWEARQLLCKLKVDEECS